MSKFKRICCFIGDFGPQSFCAARPRTIISSPALRLEIGALLREYVPQAERRADAPGQTGANKVL